MAQQHGPFQYFNSLLGVCAPRDDSSDIPCNPLLKPALLFFWMKALSHVRRPPYASAVRNILLIILFLLLIGAFPGWGYSPRLGYYPFGGIGLMLLIVLILALTGRL
jgi:hypothetical protein